MVNFKKIVASIASVAIVLATSVTNVQAYSDVPSSVWFAPYVDALSSAGIFDGSIDNFRPGDNMNRAEFVKTLVAAAGIDTNNVADAGFSDVKDQWFAKYVNAAAAKGIIDGPVAAKGKKFFPNDNISRAAAVKIALGAFGVDAEKYQDPKTSFNDISGHWGSKYITAAYNLSIVDGVGGSKNTFAPDTNIARSAVAKIAAYSVIVADDINSYVRFEDGTSAFSSYTADDIKKMVGDLVDVGTKDGEGGSRGTGTTTAKSDGSLEISLSADSPKGAIIPYGIAGIELARFDITANGDDVLLSSITLTRKGLGSKDDFESVVIFDENGGRISKTKNFNSDDEALINFDQGGLVIASGETRTISVRGSISSSKDNVKGNRDAITIASATAVASNALEVTGDFPINGATFEVGSQSGGTLTFATDGNTPDVKIGELEADVMKFKVTNSSVEDVYLKGVTVKELGDVDEREALSNLKLYNGVNLLSGPVKQMKTKYVSFSFKEPFLIKMGKTERFSVKSDVTGGASKKISFTLENKIDVLAAGKKYGYGAAITGGLILTEMSDSSENTIEIKAGKVTVLKVDPPSTKVRKNKKDVVLGKFKIVTAAGKKLEFSQVKIKIIQNGTSTASLATLLDNVEIFDELKGTTFGLSGDTPSGTSATYSDNSLAITLVDNETRTFAIRADTQNVNTISGATFNVSIPGTIGTSTGGIVIKETDNDVVVSDITPASVSFNSVDGQISSSRYSVNALSNAKNAVIGTDNVVALDFQIQSDDTTALKIKEIKIQSTGSTNGFANTQVSEVKLWKKEGTNETPIKSKSNIANGLITFDSLDINIAKDTTFRFVVTVNLVDDIGNKDKTIRLQVPVDGISIDDQDNESVSGNSEAIVSDRTITIVPTGSLKVYMDNSSSSYPGLTGNADIMKYSQNLLAGTTTDYVAAINAKATNEQVVIQEFKVNIYSGGSLFADAYKTIEAVSVYSQDGTLIAQEVPRAGLGTVTYTNFNKTVGETEEYLYVKYRLKETGNSSSAGPVDSINLTISVTKAKGASSGDPLTEIIDYTGTGKSIGGTGNVTLASNTGTITAIKVSGVELVKDTGGAGAVSFVENPATLVGSAKVLGIVKINVAASINKDNSDNALKFILNKLNVKISKSSLISFSSLYVEKQGGSEKMYVNYTGSWIKNATTSTGFNNATNGSGYTTLYAVFDTATSSLLGSSEIRPGNASYFVVRADISSADGSNRDSIQVGLDAFNGTAPSSTGGTATETASSITWGVSSAFNGSVSETRSNLRLGGTPSLNGFQQVEQTNN